MDDNPEGGERTCPACDATVKEEDETCPSCRLKLFLCPECDNLLTEHDNKCLKCGLEFESGDSGETEDMALSEEGEYATGESDEGAEDSEHETEKAEVEEQVLELKSEDELLIKDMAEEGTDKRANIIEEQVRQAVLAQAMASHEPEKEHPIDEKEEKFSVEGHTQKIPKSPSLKTRSQIAQFGRKGAEEAPFREIEERFYQPNIRFVQSFVVLLFFLITISFALQFTLLKEYWYDNFFAYNMYLMITAVAGIFFAGYLILKSTPETPARVYESDKRKMIGITSLIVALIMFIILAIFGEGMGPEALVINVIIVYSILGIVQWSPTLSESDVKKLFIAYTGVLLILLVPVHEAFGPYQTDFANLPWHMGNEILVIIGVILTAVAFASIRANTAYLAIWLYGLLILFLIPFHESANIIATSTYEPWDHTLASIGVVTTAIGAIGFLVRKMQYDSIAKNLVRGNERFDKGEYEEALKHYERSLDIAIRSNVGMSYATPWYSIANALAQMGKPDEALPRYDIAISIDSNDNLTWANKGNCLAQMNRFNDALESYNISLEMDAENVGVWFSKGSVEMGLGRLEEADASYEAVLNLDYENIEAWKARAEVNLLMGKYEEAIKDLDNGLALSPDNYELILEKAKAYRKGGNTKNAIANLGLILSKDPKYSGAVVERAGMFYDEGKFKESKKLLDTLFPETATEFKSRVLMTKLHIKMGEQEEAAAMLASLTEQYGERTELLYLIGAAQDSGASIKEAVATYRKAVGRSRTLAEFSLISRALESYERYLEEVPNDIEISKAKVEALVKLGRYFDALNVVENAMKVDDKDKELWDLNGETLLHLQRYPEALKCFEESIGIDEENKKAWFNMGNTFAKINRLDKAIECYNRVLEIDPQFSPALRNRNVSIKARSIHKSVAL